MIAKIEIKNTGQTPAHDFDANFRFDVHSWPRAEFLHGESSSIFPSATVLGPGVPVDLTLPFPEILTKQNRDRFVKGEKGIFVFGTITYVDAFKKKRETHVRLAFIGQGEEPGNHILLSPMEQGNTAT